MIFGSIWVPMSPKIEVLKMKNTSAGPRESTPVHLGANCEFNLEGTCSIQLSHGRYCLSKGQDRPFPTALPRRGVSKNAVSLPFVASCDRALDSICRRATFGAGSSAIPPG